MSVIGRASPWLTGVNAFSFNISSDQLNANLRTLAVNAGWDTTSPVVATLKNGVKCHSTSNGGIGLTVNGSFPLGVSLIIEATAKIYGGYGLGGASTGSGGANNGSAGGTALSVSVPITITNNGEVAGGGGGGGSGGPGSGGTGFTEGGAGGTGAYGTTGATAGGPGGPTAGGAGGAGGALGTAGSAGIGDYFGPGSGGPAGNSVTGNSNITWLVTGTRTGPIT